MTNPERIKQILLSEIDKMNQHREDFCRRPGIFCTLKHAIAAVNFHSKSRQMITHEIWARLILFNFCSYITGQVAFKEQKRRHVHQVDFSLDFKTCRHFLRLHSGGPAGCGRPNQKSTLFLSGPVNCNDKNDYPLLVVFLNLSITLRLPSLL